MDNSGEGKARSVLGINLPELISGLALVAFGLAVVIEASGYNLGTLTRMGPGYFPLVLGISIAVLGFAVVAEGRGNREIARLAPFRPIACILLSMLAFAYLVERFGLVPAAFALVFISSLAQHENRMVPTLILAAGVSLLGVLVFLRGFGIPLSIIRW